MSKVLGARALVAALALAGAAMSAAGLFLADIASAGFSLVHDRSAPRYESAVATAKSRLFVTAYETRSATTWGEIAREMTLSDPLAEESYLCTNGFRKPMAEIRDEKIPSKVPLQLVLRVGACAKH